MHTEVSVTQGKRYDVAVLKQQLDSPIEWVNNGSKRFDAGDLSAAIELKFVKNRCYYPTTCSIRDDRLIGWTTDEIITRLETDANKLAADLTALDGLPASVETHLVIFSNNNYLFGEPLTEVDRSQPRKVAAGAAAQRWLSETRGDTHVWYAHPRGLLRLGS